MIQFRNISLTLDIKNLSRFKKLYNSLFNCYKCFSKNISGKLSYSICDLKRSHIMEKIKMILSSKNPSSRKSLCCAVFVECITRIEKVKFEFNDKS